MENGDNYCHMNAYYIHMAWTSSAVKLYGTITDKTVYAKRLVIPIIFLFFGNQG